MYGIEYFSRYCICFLCPSKLCVVHFKCMHACIVSFLPPANCLSAYLLHSSLLYCAVLYPPACRSSTPIILGEDRTGQRSWHGHLPTETVCAVLCRTLLRLIFSCTLCDLNLESPLFERADTQRPFAVVDQRIARYVERETKYQKCIGRVGYGLAYRCRNHPREHETARCSFRGLLHGEKHFHRIFVVVVFFFVV